jgi:hypothetical protein
MNGEMEEILIKTNGSCGNSAVLKLSPNNCHLENCHLKNCHLESCHLGKY